MILASTILEDNIDDRPVLLVTAGGNGLIMVREAFRPVGPLNAPPQQWEVGRRASAVPTASQGSFDVSTRVSSASDGNMFYLSMVTYSYSHRLPDDKLLRALSEFVAIPSVSQVARRHEDCQKAAIWLKKHLRRLGADATLVSVTPAPRM